MSAFEILLQVGLIFWTKCVLYCNGNMYHAHAQVGSSNYNRSTEKQLAPACKTRLKCHDATYSCCAMQKVTVDNAQML